MAMRPSTSALLGELLAIGVPRLDATDPGLVYGADGQPIGPLSAPAVQPVTPTAGSTVNMTDDGRTSLLYLTPAGTLATLTVNLPSNAKSVVGQQERIFSTAALTALTVGQIGGGATIINPATTLAANGTLLYQKVAANTWVRM